MAYKIPPPPVYKIAPGSETETQIVERYNAGETLVDLANAYGFSPGGIRRVLLRRGVKMRRRGYKRFRNDGLTYGQRLYRKGMMDVEWAEAYRQRKRFEQVRRDFGLTKEEYLELLDAQDGRCAICQTTTPAGKSLSVDHCHETHAIRGLLCDACNTGIGLFRDDTRLLNAAAEYLHLPPYKSGAKALAAKKR